MSRLSRLCCWNQRPEGRAAEDPDIGRQIRLCPGKFQLEPFGDLCKTPWSHLRKHTVSSFFDVRRSPGVAAGARAACAGKKRLEQPVTEPMDSRNGLGSQSHRFRVAVLAYPPPAGNFPQQASAAGEAQDRLPSGFLKPAVRQARQAGEQRLRGLTWPVARSIQTEPS